MRHEHPRKATLAVLAVFLTAGCAHFPDAWNGAGRGAEGNASQLASESGAQPTAKRKKTPAQQQARFEAIGERYRQTHASDDGTIRVDGLLIAAAQRTEMVESSKRLGLTKAAGITRTSWTDLGPDKIGGRGRALLIDPADANRMWFGAATGGIWTTTDGGANWNPVNDYLPNLAISHMAMDTTNPNVMYAASGEPFASGVSGNGAFRGVGIFKSTDRGTTWSILPATQVTSAADPWIAVHRVAVNPANGNHVWAATRGGLWQSTNGGTTWTRKPLPAEGTDCAGSGGICSVNELAFHPLNAQQFVVAAGALMYSSTDGGGSFTVTRLTNATLPARNPPDGVRVSIAPDGNAAGRFVASVNHAEPDTVGVPASTDRGQVWLTTDTGATWTWIATPRHLGGQGDYDNAIWVDPTSSNVIVTAGIDVWRALDGVTFVKVSNWSGPREFQAHADHHHIVHHPGYGTANRKVFVANDGGIQVANDILTVNTASDVTSGWSRLNTRLKITQFYTITARLVNGRLQVLGGTQDNGNPLLRPTGTTDWEDITGGDGAGVGIDSVDPRRMYTAYIYSTPQSGVDGVSPQLSICTTAQIPGGCANGSGEVPGGATSNFIAPMILDPNNNSRLLTGTNDLWLSTNPTADPASAVAWANIKTGFPVGDGNYISSIEVARGNSDVIMVGHNGGQVFRTTNGTATTPNWTQVSTGGMPARYNTNISIDPRNASRAWATFGGFETSNVWFTGDAGATWSNIHNNLPMQPVYRVLPHPTRDNWLYAATETGVYTSEDGGATWSATDDGPAFVVVHDMTFVGDTLVVGTHGRGAWRADTVVASNPPRLGNISTRGRVLTGNDVMIGGFVIGGSASKSVLIRARGPSMIPAGVTDALADPQMTLVNQATSAIIGTNDNWGVASNSGAITATGKAPTNALESAILTTLAPGAYTAVVSGVGGGVGVGIVEVFEIDGPQIPLSNISTRGQVQTGNNVMIGGFVIDGSGPQTVLIRARGPSMIPAGVTNAIADPTMTLVEQATSTILATNDNWGSASNSSAITATGLAPTNALESAILTTLAPGAYTVVVSGVNNGTGVGIVEVFAQ